MLKIGDFSKLSRISIRMLRHYDEIGLLKPEKVDVFTGYRYYDESQLLDGERIQVLKNMGFGLSVIREIMENYADPEELKHFLEIKRHEIAEQEQILRRRKHLIDSTMEWLRKDGNIMGYDVSLKILPKRYVASVRQVIPSYEEEGRLWHIMMEETLGRNIRYDSPAYDLAVFYDGEHMEGNVDVEVQRAVTGTYQDTEHVKFKTAPQVQYAGAAFKGQYEKITKVNEAVAKWCADNGYEFDGMGFNIYHVGPKDTQDPEEYVTEVCYPVKKKQ
ncbi:MULTISPECIES: MerR family transcriptional regulator [Blautia]|uniref:MerR family transcriptional regulator n=1 Tax=Blautia hominis TaxID=2025493 RepID=A0ABQ0BF94_9FIRM|nr:MerR family transcriptional regulator [Blautia marasmi]